MGHKHKHTSSKTDEKGNNDSQVNLPGSKTILTLGSLSVPFAGLLGLIFATLSLSMAGKALELYSANPEKYTVESYKRVKTGKVFAIIGVALVPVLFFTFLFLFGR